MRIEVRLRQVTADGVPCPAPELTLRVRTRYGDYTEVRFWVDTGADLSAIPVPLARAEGIPFDPSVPSTATGLVGAATKYLGRIHVLLAGVEHDWPCNFIEVPRTAAAGRSDPTRRAVLGRAGFLDAYAFCMDGEKLTITRHSRLRRGWKKVLRALRLHPATRRRNQPL
jgi:hypothetical protein